MITNMTKVVDPVPLTEPEVFLLITDDFNGINAGNMLVKNCEKGIEFLKFILSKEGSTQPGETNEQDIISTEWRKGNEGIKVLPQQSMNSYDMSLYGPAPNEGSINKYRCQWETGDLAIHWPGSSLEKRIDLFKKYSELVIR